jgi:hypothetical protein
MRPSNVVAKTTYLGTISPDFDAENKRLEFTFGFIYICQTGRTLCKAAEVAEQPQRPQTASGSLLGSVSFPGFPVPDFPGSRRFFHSRFLGESVRDSREKDLLGKFVYSSSISSIFHQVLGICLKIHNWVYATSCKELWCVHM